MFVWVSMLSPISGLPLASESRECGEVCFCSVVIYPAGVDYTRLASNNPYPALL